MPDSSDAARSHLAAAIKAAGTTAKAVSLSLGLNHAYLQQYIMNGKPAWLKENVREALGKLLPNLDQEKLKPPARNIRRPQSSKLTQSDNEMQVDAPRYGQFVDDPGTLDLLSVWNRITDPRPARTRDGDTAYHGQPPRPGSCLARRWDCPDEARLEVFLRY